MRQSWCDMMPSARFGTTFVAAVPEREDGSSRSFGGHLSAIALWAAADGVAGKAPNSFHGYFVRAVPTGAELAGTVADLGDGRLITRRLVSLACQDKLVYSAIVSLHAEGADSRAPRDSGFPAVSSPGEYAGNAMPLALGAIRGWFDQRLVRADPLCFWVRSAPPLPPDPIAPYAVAASMTDIGLVRASDPGAADAAVDRHGQPDGVTLEHSMWFHRRPNPGDWSVSAAAGTMSRDGRALAAGHLWAADGTLQATYIQDVLARRTASTSREGST